jgi:hypothetical protein
VYTLQYQTPDGWWHSIEQLPSTDAANAQYRLLRKLDVRVLAAKIIDAITGKLVYVIQ